jgi:hypothetical protein
LLNSEFFAEPTIDVGGVEVDVGTFRREETDAGAVPIATWAPPQPAITVSLDPTVPESCSVQITQNCGGPELRAVIELISPANKDRDSHRRTFATKCAAYLNQGVSLVIVDVVTNRSADLHSLIAELLGLSHEMEWRSATGLYALAYRVDKNHQPPRLEIWPATLAIGAELPTLPLWIGDDLSLQLDLEKSYQATRDLLNVAG